MWGDKRIETKVFVEGIENETGTSPADYFEISDRLCQWLITVN